MNTQPNERKRVLILDDAVEFRQLESVAAEAGWPLTNRYTQSFDLGVEVQWDVTSGVVMTYMEYHIDAVRLVSIYGDDAAAVDAAAETVAAAVSAREPESVLDEVLSEPAPEPLALLRAWRTLIVACAQLPSDQPMDERLLTAMAATLRHPNRQVRFRAFIAADKLGGRWPQLLEPVLARKGEETELDYMVEAFERTLAVKAE